jgi:hypothetical protein
MDSNNAAVQTASAGPVRPESYLRISIAKTAVKRVTIWFYNHGALSTRLTTMIFAAFNLRGA